MYRRPPDQLASLWSSDARGAHRLARRGHVGRQLRLDLRIGLHSPRRPDRSRRRSPRVATVAARRAAHRRSSARAAGAGARAPAAARAAGWRRRPGMPASSRPGAGGRRVDRHPVLACNAAQGGRLTLRGDALRRVVLGLFASPTITVRHESPSPYSQSRRRRNGSAPTAHGQPGSVYSVMRTSAPRPSSRARSARTPSPGVVTRLTRALYPKLPRVMRTRSAAVAVFDRALHRYLPCPPARTACRACTRLTTRSRNRCRKPPRPPHRSAPEPRSRVLRGELPRMSSMVAWRSFCWRPSNHGT